MKQMKKALCLLLSLLLCLSSFPASALAADGEVPAEELCEDECCDHDHDHGGEPAEAEVSEETPAEEPAEVETEETPAEESAEVETEETPVEAEVPEETPAEEPAEVEETEEVPAEEPAEAVEAEEAPIEEPAEIEEAEEAPAEEPAEVEIAKTTVTFVCEGTADLALLSVFAEGDREHPVEAREPGVYELLPGEYVYTYPGMDEGKFTVGAEALTVTFALPDEAEEPVEEEAPAEAVTEEVPAEEPVKEEPPVEELVEAEEPAEEESPAEPTEEPEEAAEEVSVEVSAEKPVASTVTRPASVSYAYPNTHVNTGNPAYDMAQVALTQVGYTETGENHTKYAEWYYGTDIAAEWCAVFVSWCANQAGATNVHKAEQADPAQFGVTWYGYYDTPPQVGDIAFVENDGYADSDGMYGTDHVGIICEVTSSYVYVVEGNSSNAVQKVTYNRSNGHNTADNDVYIGIIGRLNPSQTSNVNAVTATAGKTKAQLMAMYPNGKYWNHMGSSSNAPGGYTSTPCNHSQNGTSYCNFYVENGKSKACQCMGFAYQLAALAYGDTPYTSRTMNHSVSALNSLKSGDIIVYKCYSASDNGHTVFVTGVSGNTVTFADCNWSGPCQIRWDATASKSTFEDGFYGVDPAPYAWDGGGSIIPTIPVDHKYDGLLPMETYMIGSSDVTTYDSASLTSSTGYIERNDRCAIVEVYTNGACKITYPTGSSSRTAYASANKFIGTQSATPTSVKATKNITTYIDPTPSDNFNDGITSGTTFYKLGTNGSMTQVIYRYSGVYNSSYRMAWVYTSDLTCSHTSDNGTVTKAATCTAAGTRTYKCTKCGATIRTESIAALGHSWNSGVVTKAATCAATGVKTYTCTRCKTTKTETIAKSTVHTWNSGVVTKAATCAATGVKTYTCTVCGATKTETIAKSTTHSWNSGVVTKAATCAATGVRTYTCTVCGATKTETIAKSTVHTWNSGVVTKAATCAATGEKTYTCTVCGATKTESLAKSTVHTWNSGEVTTAPTCGTVGERTYTCTVCGTMKTELIGATSDHSWDSGYVNRAATVEASGQKTYTCTVCGKTKTEIVLAKPTLNAPTNTTGGVKLSWSAVEGAAGYRVGRKGPGESTYKLLATPTGTTYVDATAVTGTAYTYMVRAVNGSVQSGYNTRSITCVKTLAKPTLNTPVNTSSGVQLSWSAVTYAKGYRVGRKGPGESSYKLLATPTDTSYTDTTAVAGTTYSYIVRAAVGSVQSSFNTGKSITCVKSLTKPTLKTPVNTSAGVKLSWSAVTNATGYRVGRKGPGETSYQLIATPSGTSYVDTTAAAGTTYSYMVRATNDSVQSSYNTVSIKCVKSLAKPTVSTPVNTEYGVKISWSSVTNATGYRVGRKGPGETSYKLIGTPSGTTFLDADVQKGTTYTYIVRATNGDVQSGYNTGTSITVK